MKPCAAFTAHASNPDGLESACSDCTSVRRRAKTLAQRKMLGLPLMTGADVEKPDDGWEPGAYPIYGQVGNGTKPSPFGTFVTDQGWSEFMLIDGREYGNGEISRIPVEAPLTQAIMKDLKDREDLKDQQAVVWINRVAPPKKGVYYELRTQAEDEAFMREFYRQVDEELLEACGCGGTVDICLRPIPMKTKRRRWDDETKPRRWAAPAGALPPIEGGRANHNRYKRT